MRELYNHSAQMSIRYRTFTRAALRLTHVVKSASAGLVFPCSTECREDPAGKLKDGHVIGGLGGAGAVPSASGPPKRPDPPTPSGGDGSISLPRRGVPLSPMSALKLHYGLKSDIAPGPKSSAITRSAQRPSVHLSSFKPRQLRRPKEKPLEGCEVSSIEKSGLSRSFLLLWARMPLTIVSEIRPGRRVVGLVTLGAIGRISAARYYGAGVPVVAGVVVSVAVAIIIGVVVAKIGIGIVVATVAITQRATGPYPATTAASPT